MVCTLCYDLLFGFLVDGVPSTSNTGRIAALSCGHTFHFDCVALWLYNSVNKECPVCKAYHSGPILKLHIECDLDHVANGLIDDQLWAAELLCNLSLDSAEQQEVEYRELETKMAALQVKLDETTGPLKTMEAKLRALHKKMALLETREKELSTLSARHKVNIQGLNGALELKDRNIARLKVKLSERVAKLALEHNRHSF
ncbi:hypothetical protein GGI14_004445 [Coemansia sp. S680]|nr:hypothetical protein GGI14_004445 [Coemansia sp. S680]